MRKPIVFLFTFIAAILLLGQVFAGAGDADPTWGQNGLATANFGDFTETANTALLDSAGRLLLAGYVEPAGYPGDFGLARFLGNGALDPAFGTGGRVTTDFDGGPDSVWSLAQRPGGGYFASGEACDENFDICLLAVAAYTESGALDTTFGGDGRVTTDLGTDYALGWARRSIVQPDGKLITGNLLVRGAGTNARGEMVLARYLTGGDLDPDFGADGLVFIKLDDVTAYPFSLRLLPDGRILVGGAIGTYIDISRYTPLMAFIARFDGGGALDDTFGVDGFLTWDDAGDPVDGAGLAVGGDGSLYQVAVRGFDGDDLDCVVRRFSAGGQPDVSFGSGGAAILATAGDDRCRSLDLDAAGRLVTGGTTRSSDGGQPGANAFLAARLLPGGAPDTTFGSGGIAVHAVTGAILNGRYGAVQPDGRVLVTGDREQGGEKDFAAVRFLGEGETPPTTIPTSTPTATPPPPPPGSPRLYLPYVQR